MYVLPDFFKMPADRQRRGTTSRPWRPRSAAYVYHRCPMCPKKRCHRRRCCGRRCRYRGTTQTDESAVGRPPRASSSRAARCWESASAGENRGLVALGRARKESRNSFDLRAVLGNAPGPPPFCRPSWLRWGLLLPPPLPSTTSTKPFSDVLPPPDRHHHTRLRKYLSS